MKSRTEILTTIEVELSAADIFEYVVSKNLIPKGWKFYSVEVVGKPVSEGAKLIIRHTALKNPENPENPE